MIRRYPVRPEQVDGSLSAHARSLEQRARVEKFLQRAVDAGLIRAGLPDGLTWFLLHDLVGMMALRFPELESGRAADLAVDVLLEGIGRD